MVNNITDDLACEITALASNIGNPDDHAVIDRIDGILVSILNDKCLHTVSISESENRLTINREDHTKVRTTRRIFNKGIITQKLSDIGIDNVAYNPH